MKQFKHQWVVVLLVSVLAVSTITFFLIWTPFYVVQHEPTDPYSVARRVLTSSPLVDGHNGLPSHLRNLLHNQLSKIDLRQNLTDDPLWGFENCTNCHTDIPRLREGLLGSQFFVASSSCETEFRDAVEQTLEQIDVIQRLVGNYSDEFQLATSAEQIENAFYNSRIGVLIGIDGGHAIDNRLSVLRSYYQLGARYLTLSHNCNTSWVQSSDFDEFPEENNSTGISQFGKLVIREMNRLGMIIDLTHSSLQSQMDVFQLSRAPVIFSHSNAYALCDNHQNVRDEVLELLRDNGGLLMVNFDAPSVNCSANATIADVANQINYIRNISGVDHVGIGSSFDTSDMLVLGLEDVSKFIELFAHLAGDEETPWTELELEKLAGNNFLRVLAAVEEIGEVMRENGETPAEEWIPEEELSNHTECITQSGDEPQTDYFYYTDEL